MDDHQPIILFDGNCMLCNNFIRFVFKHDNGRFLFISSQSSIGKELCVKFFLPQEINLDTVYLIKKNEIYSKSTAVSKILFHCGIFLKMISVLILLVPLFIRNFFYDFIAKNRHKISKNKCAIIDKNELERVFL